MQVHLVVVEPDETIDVGSVSKVPAARADDFVQLGASPRNIHFGEPVHDPFQRYGPCCACLTITFLVWLVLWLMGAAPP